MAGTNDFQTFASGSGANVLTQQQYLALTSLLQNGFQTGIAQSNQANKLFRQLSIITSMIGQFIVDYSGQSATDDGTIATLERNFVNAMQGVGRIKLTSGLNLYVSPTGSDTANNGTAQASPFLTIQKAVNTVYQNYDTQGQTVTINVAQGTYGAGATAVGPVLGNSSIKIVGNTASPSTTTVSVNGASGQACFTASLGAALTVSGFALAAPGGATQSGNFVNVGTCLHATSGGQILFDHVNFGTTGFAHINAGASGVVSLNAVGSGTPYTITGGAAYHMIAGSAAGVATIPGGTVTLSGTPAFSSAFVWADAGGLVYAVGATFSGAATGSRYQISNGGYVATGSNANTSFFPGSTAGTNPSGYYS